MKQVCLIRSFYHPDQRCVGRTSAWPERLKQHNGGQSTHTSTFCPWQPFVVIRFEDDAKALDFEKHLKRGSGHADANRHLW